MSILSKTLRASALGKAVSAAASAPVSAAKAGISTLNQPHFHGLKGDKKCEIKANAVDALRPYLKSGQNVFLQMAAATPTDLLQGCADLHESVDKVKMWHMSLNGPLPHLEDNIPFGKFTSMSCFTSPNVRPHLATGRAEFVPVFFSEVPKLYRSGAIPLDIALINVSPPDANGWCSLGISVECAVAAVQTAKVVIAQFNPTMPRTHGDAAVHISAIDAAIEAKTPVYYASDPPITEVDATIGKYCASLIPDGATLQIGIGSIPNAVLAQLGGHKDIGIHTELMCDGALPLIKSGVVNNRRKKVFANHLVSTFLTGSKELFDFAHDNPEMQMLDVSTVNNPAVIAMNDNMIALNSAIEVDLTGQICADSIGTRIFSGFGGQMDFMRGAAISQGGKPIIAMPSTTAKGQSKISKMLAPGAGVVTTRGHVHYVVTEYGIAELNGKSLQERARNLIAVSHPDHRDDLAAFCRERFGRSIY